MNIKELIEVYRDEETKLKEILTNYPAGTEGVATVSEMLLEQLQIKIKHLKTMQKEMLEFAEDYVPGGDWENRLTQFSFDIIKEFGLEKKE